MNLQIPVAIINIITFNDLLNNIPMSNSIFTTKHRNMTFGWPGVPLFELSRQIKLS